MISTERTRRGMSAVLSGERRGFGSKFLFVGPAVIASIAYVDPGNYATNIQAGAGYGYVLLWVVLLANLIAMLFQSLSARLGIVTGKNLAEMSRDNFPRPVVWAMWAVSEVAAMATRISQAQKPNTMYGRSRSSSPRRARSQPSRKVIKNRKWQGA